MWACCSTNVTKPAEDDLEVTEQKKTLFSYACEEDLSSLEELSSSAPSLKEPEASREVAPSKTRPRTTKKPAGKKAASSAGAEGVKAEAPSNTKEQKAKADKLQVEAQAEVKQRNFTSAVELFSAAIDLNAESAESWAGRGRARLLTSSLNEALSDLNEAVRLDAVLVCALRDRAEVKCLLDDLDGSIEDYNKYLSLTPCDGRALHLRGNAKLRQGNKGEAEKDFGLARRMGYTGAAPTSGGA